MFLSILSSRIGYKGYFLFWIWTAYQIAEGRKAAKRARQEIARAKELESQKHFTTQTKSRKQAELAEYVTSTQAAKNEVKKVYKNLNKTV